MNYQRFKDDPFCMYNELGKIYEVQDFKLLTVDNVPLS